MERKIDEIFEFEGKQLQVHEIAYNNCEGCFFDGKCFRSRKVAGDCEPDCRTDGKSVIFVEVQEQPHGQDEQSQKLNLCELLKHCPQGETFWSPMLDDVKFSCIDEERQMIIVETTEGHFTWEINADGTISIDEVTSPEVMLYPSREQRDWTKVKYEPKKERFDPKTLKAFDKVLCWNGNDCVWECDFFSYYKEDRLHPCVCINGSYISVIPYNDETQKFAGTSKITREYYRYWED